LGGLEPTLTWSATGKAGDVDIEYGVEADARLSSDLASLPKNVWGKASTDIGGWGVTARAEFQGTDFSAADIEIDAVNEDLSIHIDAASTGDFNINKIEATKSFDTDDAAVTVTPRYNVDSGDTDVVVSYVKDDTSIEVTASQDAQTITVSKQVDEDNRVAPTLGSNGEFSVEWESSLGDDNSLTTTLTPNESVDVEWKDNRVAPTLGSNGEFSVEWERSLGDDNSLTTTLTPNESVDVEWKDSAWTASFNMPLDGTSISGANVSIKRDVAF